MRTGNGSRPPGYPVVVKPFLVYTGLRLGLFALCFVVLGAIAVQLFDGQWPLIIAVFGGGIVSSILSLKFLAGPRDEFARVVEARAAAAHQRFEASRSKEDQD